MDALPDMKRELKYFPVENENPQKLTAEQIRQFNEKGYIFPLDVFTEKEVAANRAYFDRIMEMAKAAGLNSYSINGWHPTCRGIYDLALDSRILDYVQDLLGENLICTMTHYFSKEPGDKKQVTWHQDASYWPLTPSKVVTVWLAIDDADEENSAMKVIPGSHLRGQIPFEHSTAEENNVLGQSVHQAEDYGEMPVAFEMKAGQVSLHTDLLLHGSEPNTSNRRRCGLTLRYFPPDVRGRDPKHGSGIICRGGDSEGYWQHIPRPEGDQIRRM
jgi:ectoine hydroxylase-related dioxygenase (phytanoyl-CoA dioxygenase family)